VVFLSTTLADKSNIIGAAYVNALSALTIANLP